MTAPSRLVVISPVRNEEKNIGATLSSVIAQTARPVRWVIVDDGSIDRTAEIAESHAAQHPWISVLRLSDRGYYDLMFGGEIKAFYEGLRTIRDVDFAFLGKLDGDVSFGPTYYEDLLQRFNALPRLGIAGGGCYYLSGGRMVYEPAYELHVRGAARLYRRACWDDIGGVIPGLGWDAVDCYKARMLGWQTRTFEDIRFIHHVVTWTKGGLLHGRKRSGRIEYLMGTHPLFFASKVLREIGRRPYLLRAYCVTVGYLQSAFRGEKRVCDPYLLRYIRREQLDRLLKRRAGSRDRMRERGGRY